MNFLFFSRSVWLKSFFSSVDLYRKGASFFIGSLLFLFSVSSVYAIVFIFSFLLLAFGLICSYFSSSLRLKLLLIWGSFFFHTGLHKDHPALSVCASSRFPVICGSFSKPLFTHVSPFPNFFPWSFGLSPACPVCSPLLQVLHLVLNAFGRESPEAGKTVAGIWAHPSGIHHTDQTT